MILNLYNFRSEVLLNGIQQLVDEVLSRKGHSFCLKIDKQVDKFLNPNPDIESNVVSDNASQTESIGNSTSDTIISPSSQDSPNEPAGTTATPTDVSINNLNNHLESSEIGDKTTIHNKETEENLVTEFEEVSTEIDGNKSIENKEDKQIEETGIKQIIHETVDKEENSLEKAQDNSEKDIEIKNNAEKEKENDEEPINEEPFKNENVLFEKNDNFEDVNREKQENVETDSTNLVSNEVENEDSQVEENVENVEDLSENEGRIVDEKDKENITNTINNPTESSYYSGLQTEPISDDSTSNSFDSNFDQISEASESIEDKHSEDPESNLRKSKRVRNVPLKYRTEVTNKDGYDSISSTDTDPDDKKRSRSSNRLKQPEQIIKLKKKEETSDTKKRRGRVQEQDSKSQNKRKRSPSDSGSNRSVSSSANIKRNHRKVDSPSENVSNNSRDANKERQDSRYGVSFKRSRRPTKQRERYSPS